MSWTRWNTTQLVLVNIVCGPHEMPPLTWILIMDHLLVMDHIECIIGKYVCHTGYYRDNSGHRPDGMTLNDTIVMDTSYGSYGMITAMNNYQLWTIWNASLANMYTKVTDTGYYWDNSGDRPDGLTLNDTIVMDIFLLWTTLNEYWLWTRCNKTIVMGWPRKELANHVG